MFGVVCAAFGTGCAPSMDTMVRTRNVSELICYVAQEGDAEKQHQARTALRDIYEPVMHLHAVSDSELEAAGIAPRVKKEHVLVKPRLDGHKTELGEVYATITLNSNGRDLEMLAGREELAVLTRERSPDTVGGGSAGGAGGSGSSPGLLHAFAILGGGLVQAVTLGIVPGVKAAEDLSRRFRNSYDTFVGIGGSFYKVENRASETVERITQASSLDDAGVVAWPRPAAGAARIRVSWDYRASRGCGLDDWAEIELPPAATAEARIQKVFGEKMVRVGDVAARWRGAGD